MKDLKLKLEAFQKLLSANPTNLKTQRAGNTTYEYLPISHVQNLLDELFFGMWSWEVSQPLIVSNEMVLTGILTVTHPVTGKEIKRSGVASTAIRQTKGASILDVGAKLKNALEQDAPKVSVEALKNAAKHLGPVFGRDLNRDEDTVATYTPTKTNWLKGKVLEIEQDCTSIKELDLAIERNPELLELSSTSKKINEIRQKLLSINGTK